MRGATSATPWIVVAILSLCAFAPPAGAQTPGPLSAGRYLPAHGVSPGTIRAGSGTAQQPFTPYSGSYIPKHNGPLTRKNDEQLMTRLTNGFNSGDCDIVLPVIKENAALSTAHKFDEAVENSDGASPGLVQYYDGVDSLEEQGKLVREFQDKIEAFNDESKSLVADIETFENERAGLSAAERDRRLEALRVRADELNKKRRDLVKDQRTMEAFFPNNAALKRIRYFEDGLPRTWWDPNSLARWRGYAPESQSWEGFCHSWAPAGLDPVADLIVRTDRIYANVPFGIGDLRELTSFMYPNPRSRFFGKRNYGENYDAERDDLTPVDLHAILTTFVGRNKPGVVFDVDPGVQVWNQPVYKYEFDAEEVAAPGGLTVPAGGRVLKVTMTATYGLEGSFAYRGDTISGSLGLQYHLVTDAAGNIVDGAWIGHNRVPDFAWVPEPGAMNDGYNKLKEIADQGIPVALIEEFCQKLAALPAGPQLDPTKAAELTRLLDAICIVCDQNELNTYMRNIAEEKGYDYSELSARLRGLTPPVG